MQHISEKATAVAVAAPALTPPLALAVLSHRIGESRARNAASASHRLCKFLALCGAQRDSAGGTLLPCPGPELAGRDWPTGEYALSKLGMTQPEIRERFRREQRFHGVRGCLEPNLVSTFVPRELWPVVELMASEGGEVAARRVWFALEEYAASELPGNRHRSSGPPSRGSILGLRDESKRLFRTFVALRAGEFPAPELASWSAVPQIEMPDGGRQGVDTSAPRPEQVRLALGELNGLIADELGLRVGEDEIEAIRNMTVTAMLRSRLFRLLRDRATVLLLVLTGGRVSAIAALRRSDYISDHEGPAPDYRNGPALALRPGKNLPLEQVRWKPLPPGAAWTIDAYLLFLERVFPAAAKTTANDPRRRSPKNKEFPTDFPLLVSNRIHFRPFGESGIRTLVSGIRPFGNSDRGRRALIAREKILNPEIPSFHRPFIGYNPHAFRHLAQQMAERAGRIYNDEHPETGGKAQPDPSLYASALLDHKPAGDPMRGLYGDHSTERAYELLSGRAIELIWQLLTTDRGARKRPDLRLIQETAADLRALDAHYQRLVEEVDKIHKTPSPGLPRKRELDGPGAGASLVELLETIRDQQRSFARSQDLLHERVDHEHRVVRRLLALNEAVRRIEEQRRELAIEITELTYNQARWEVVADSEPAGAEMLPVELKALAAGTSNAEVEGRLPDALRDWLLFSELAWACEIRNRATVSRWAAGTHLPRDPARRPWRAWPAPVDESLGLNYRRVWVPGMQETFWPSPAARTRVAQLLRRWPATQGWTVAGEPGPRCQAPLVLPTVHRRAYEDTRTNGHAALRQPDHERDEIPT